VADQATSRATVPGVPAPRPAAVAVTRPTERIATRRRYVMCPPEYFAVAYAINPWMDPTAPVDRALARAQWEALRSTYRRLGHEVSVVEPVPGQPDMVFAANAALVVGGHALGARFRHPQRRGEEPAFAEWLTAAGVAVRRAQYVNEGEGDFLVAGTRPDAPVLAGSGFRTDPASHAEVAGVLGREVVSLVLVDPRFYHLDTALAVLDDATAVVVPEAFAPESYARVEQLFPELLLATPDDAEAFGVNAVSDGRHVVLEAAATSLAERIAERGFVPVPVDTSELRKAGGSVKCCTMELHG